MATVEQKIWRRLKTLDLKEEERVKIVERLEKCFGGCEMLVSGVCTDWPNPCGRMTVWITRLTFGSCKEWEK